MVIRQEKAEDYEAVYHVVQEAFQNAEHTDGNEQNLVVALRKSKAFILQLSLVAVEDQRVVGHILHQSGCERSASPCFSAACGTAEVSKPRDWAGFDCRRTSDCAQIGIWIFGCIRAFAILSQSRLSSGKPVWNPSAVSRCG